MPHGECQSVMGCAAHPRRAHKARDRDLAAHGRPASAAPRASAVAVVGRVPGEPCSWRRWISSSYRPRRSARSSFCSFWLTSAVASSISPSPWTAQQVAEAFPWEEAPRCLSRDRDATYSMVFRERVKRVGIAEVITAARSPWQNPYVERVSRTIRRELLDSRHLARQAA